MKTIFVSSVVTDQLRSSIESIVDNRDDIVAFVMSDDIHRIPPHVTQKFIRMRLIDKLIYLTDLIKKTSDRYSSDRTGIGQIMIFCSVCDDCLFLKWLIGI
jgi:superfamily II DNA/RNA helicase